MTIPEAIVTVLRAHGAPMTVREIYDAIIGAKLYTFNTDHPVGVVRYTIRRYCQEFVHYRERRRKQLFGMLPNGTYYLLESGLVAQSQSQNYAEQNDLLIQLQQLHDQYLKETQNRILSGIKSLDPVAFERFSKQLLDVYGFHDVEVTRPSKDGGIDGYGKLRMGLADLDVAFQCKRWKGAVGRTEIDKFRGAMDGQSDQGMFFNQGIFFTTSNYSREAWKSSFKRGAIPVVLVDGPAIVDMMIEKSFGVETRFLPIYDYALDLILSNDSIA